MPNRKVLLYIAMSLDGYIAAPDDNLDFLSMVDEPGQDYGYSDFINTVDTVILGRKTYDKVMSMGYDFPHTDKDTYILTRSERPAIGTIKFFTADLEKLVIELKQKQGKDIFVDGGAETVNLLLMNELIDEFYISIIPILLGDGIQLFRQGRSEQVLKLVDSKHFNKGLVQLHYVKAESGTL